MGLLALPSWSWAGTGGSILAWMGWQTGRCPHPSPLPLPPVSGLFSLVWAWACGELMGKLERASRREGPQGRQGRHPTPEGLCPTQEAAISQQGQPVTVGMEWSREWGQKPRLPPHRAVLGKGSPAVKCSSGPCSRLLGCWEALLLPLLGRFLWGPPCHVLCAQAVSRGCPLCLTLTSAARTNLRYPEEAHQTSQG
ncbi:LOW QUALITY PROTEIN: uncharacterized protein LOC104653311 [Saimiri boliviensis]|uniref:LOW QUALITY PROTEIN: uncharacterized protein LOC104653311 n=1 Tax=Saimiri boliviensis TaxID=27679 RepID=UPI000533F5D0|nr:LOW QUALITY PROTEIN: uncharacterized protein LOC104653311 [Saimiri boliviensis boliviensis]